MICRVLLLESPLAMAERKEPLKLTNKDIRDALDHVCNYFDEKFGVWYDDGPESLRAFHAWVHDYVVGPTNDTVAEQAKPAKK